MFKFLKKKLKGFEDKLEAELEAELAKEKPKVAEEKEIKKTEPIIKPVEEKKPQPVKKEVEIKQIISEKKIKTTVIPVEIKKEEKLKIEPKKEGPIDKKEEQIFKKKEDEERRIRIEADRRKREEEIDKQIEKSIEAELEHTLKTRRGIEQAVQIDKKTAITISDEKLDELLWDLEVGLLESDVAYNVIESIKKDIKEELKHINVERGKISEVVETVLKNAISHVLMSNELDFDEFIKKHDKPVVIMFIGVNGSGKTLSIAKIAAMLKKKGYSCVMAAGDTFRAGAIEQLSIHAEKVGVKIIKHGPGADPAAVAFDAIDHAKAKHKDVVLLDTAGRVQTNINLMDEMAKIKRVAKPDLIIFVGDALSGNDAVEQARRFNEVCGIDGVILTKVDTDAKGGSALSVAYTIGKPLLFIGVGQSYEDHIPFDPEWMIKNIFGKEE
jgi:fused signal recognition particle receptor